MFISLGLPEKLQIVQYFLYQYCDQTPSDQSIAALLALMLKVSALFLSHVLVFLL